MPPYSEYTALFDSASHVIRKTSRRCTGNECRKSARIDGTRSRALSAENAGFSPTPGGLTKAEKFAYEKAPPHDGLYAQKIFSAPPKRPSAKSDFLYS